MSKFDELYDEMVPTEPLEEAVGLGTVLTKLPIKKAEVLGRVLTTAIKKAENSGKVFLVWDTGPKSGPILYDEAQLLDFFTDFDPKMIDSLKKLPVGQDWDEAIAYIYRIK
jgi:hypothetical protein